MPCSSKGIVTNFDIFIDSRNNNFYSGMQVISTVIQDTNPKENCL